MKNREIPEIDGVVYTYEGVLGQGGTAEVLKVRSSADGNVYALKQIKKDDQSARRNERFRKEIAFGMAARNDHVVGIHAQFEDPKYFYYTMDLYPKNLRQIIKETFDHRVLLDYLSQLCDGLAYVHGQDIVHRDIKPENILVDSEKQRLVLADFGIAHFKGSLLTQKDELLANRNYQAPEQMVKNSANDIGKPADIFALGLIITEVFTKQNSRGARHRLVGDVYPFLSNLDLLVERMMLQDESKRIKIQAVRDALLLIRREVDYRIEDIVEDLRHTAAPVSRDIQNADRILERAGTDVLSAKYVFERTTDEELARYNMSYRCEINYRVSDELYNSCVQSKLFSICKAKFENEANVRWDESDFGLVVSPEKDHLLIEFESIQRQYPLPRYSIWAEVPRMAAHYFRFCKDYHCEELLRDIRQILSVTRYPDDGSLHHSLVNAPIIYIASRVREYLKTDRFEISPQNLQRIEFERHVSVHWENTSLSDLSRKALGAALFGKSNYEEPISRILEEFEKKWDVSLWERHDGSYSIYFQSRDEYLRFSKEAHAVATLHSVFQGDVIDLLRTDDDYDDLVALTWEPAFDIRSTLAKVLKLRDIE